MVTIYVITNKKNGMQYVGQTADFPKRLKIHRHGNPNTLIGQAIKKYGWANFEMKPLAETGGNEADAAERLAIALLKTLYPYGYNVDNGGIRNKTTHEITKTRPVKPVKCVETGQVFESIAGASNATGITASSISNSCQCNWRAGGLHWEFIQVKNPLKKQVKYYNI